MFSNYDPRYIENHYDQDPEKEWLRLVQSRVGEISLFIHNHYLTKYLKSGLHVLDIGAGPGRFTKTLYEIGCSVVVGDISEKQLEANKIKAKEYGFHPAVEQWLKLDICQMESLKPDSFDAVVAYGGPLSYVFERADDALKECHRVLKSSGYLFVSVMSLWGSMHRFFRSVMEVPINNNRKIVQTGNLTPDVDPGSQHFCHLFRSDELQDLINSAGFKVMDMSASGSLSITHDECLEEIRKNPTLWEALLEFELEACASSGNVESGTHLLAVAEKK